MLLSHPNLATPSTDASLCDDGAFSVVLDGRLLRKLFSTSNFIIQHYDKVNGGVSYDEEQGLALAGVTTASIFTCARYNISIVHPYIGL